jgi:hypothetical protein
VCKCKSGGDDTSASTEGRKEAPLVDVDVPCSVDQPLNGVFDSGCTTARVYSPSHNPTVC